MYNLNTVNPDGSSLRKHQMLMYEMLEYVSDVCETNNIPYYLSGGTLLGAIRHQGFIPWDDDLDIVLFKKDFCKLVDLLSNSDKYDLQYYRTDPFYVAPYAKLRMRNTQIMECNSNDRYYTFKGIYIDLFYLEPAIPFLHRVANHLQNILVSVSLMNSKIIGKKIYIYCLHFLLYSFLFPLFNVLSYLISPNYVSYPLGSFFKTQFLKKWYSSPLKMKFEKDKFKVPVCFDDVLIAQYGNYHKVPSLQEIQNHVKYINFGVL